MVFEPLSAFAVACNVLQIAEIGVKALTRVSEYKTATDGTLTEHKDLREVLQNLKSLNGQLQASLPQDARTSLRTQAEQQLIESNNLCVRLSVEFIEFLNRLKVKDRKATLEGLRLSIKSLWFKDKLSAMAKGISQARDNLNMAFLIYMHSEQASLATQQDVTNSTTSLERSILDAVDSSSDSLRLEMRLLSKRLEDLRLESSQQIVTEFLTSHRNVIQQVFIQLNKAILENYQDVFFDHHREDEARERILQSLRFPQMRERRDHVQMAYEETYCWILQLTTFEEQPWDDFQSWLSSNSNHKGIYWIHGKIGSGKSCMLRFLDENLKVQDHMMPWADGSGVIQAQCFFWNPGEATLQKSFTGLLRTLLCQVFEQTPELIRPSLPDSKWRTAQAVGSHIITWTSLELQNALQTYVNRAANLFRIFFLVDGLDEFEGSDDERDELLKLLRSLSDNKNVKLCVSSRPWNVFHESFHDCPQLRLEDLTYNDIRTYVSGQLDSNRRFNYLQRLDPSGVSEFALSIVRKAEGVFLWVRLVVRELLKDLRDGAGLKELSKRLNAIPADLDDYFRQLMGSIQAAHHREAAILFQMALHYEDNFTAANPLRLIDLSFLDEDDGDFAMSWNSKNSVLDFNNKDAVLFRLDSTLRKLNSRCAGMLECHYDKRGTSMLLDVNHDEEEFSASLTMNEGESLDGALHPLIRNAVVAGGDKLFAFDFSVDFLHRSLRDFIYDRGSQLLQHYAQDEFDVRRYLRNARLAQAIDLDKAGISVHLVVGLCSYVVSSLAIPGYNVTPESARLATRLRPIVENIAHDPYHTHSFWYLDGCLSEWTNSGNNFLTVAIDFYLDSYIQMHLTREAVASKPGRPILDYILRPRFAGSTKYLKIGNQVPAMHLIQFVLNNGGDPNQPWNGSTVWALFLSYIADFVVDLQESPQQKVHYLAALAILIRHGAARVLPRKQLSVYGFYETWLDSWNSIDDSPDVRFDHRWGYQPTTSSDEADGGPAYEVRNLLDCFTPYFGAPCVGKLQELLDNRENSNRVQ